MTNSGTPKRIQKRVLEMVKKTKCWEPEKHFSDAVEKLALFCIENKSQFEKWKKNKEKNLE